MKETPQEYIKRITSYVEGEQSLKVQAATPKKLERLIKGVSVSKLRKRPALDKWSVVEILAHLADTEIVGGFRIRMILGAPGTPIPGFNQDAWVTSGHYDKRDPRKSVEQFRAFREANLALLKSITPEQWKHHGVHSERGAETVEHIVRMFAGADWVGKRTTTLPSRSIRLPIGYVKAVIEAYQNRQISLGKSSEFLMIDEGDFRSRFSEVYDEVEAEAEVA